MQSQSDSPHNSTHIEEEDTADMLAYTIWMPGGYHAAVALEMQPCGL